MLMKVQFPPQKFNDAVRDGSAGEKIGKIMATLKPKAAYFTAQNGCRGGILVIDVEDSSRIPFYAEPFFLYFDAAVDFLPYMTAEDLAKSGLETMNDMWP